MCVCVRACVRACGRASVAHETDSTSVSSDVTKLPIADIQAWRVEQERGLVKSHALSASSNHLFCLLCFYKNEDDILKMVQCWLSY